MYKALQQSILEVIGAQTAMGLAVLVQKKLQLVHQLSW